MYTFRTIIVKILIVILVVNLFMNCNIVHAYSENYDNQKNIENFFNKNEMEDKQKNQIVKDNKISMELEKSKRSKNEIIVKYKNSSKKNNMQIEKRASKKLLSNRTYAETL